MSLGYLSLGVCVLEGKCPLGKCLGGTCSEGFCPVTVVAP